MHNIAQLSGLYAGKTCWVVGSGPSIRYLESKHFGDGPVIAINYAIEMVEPLNLDNDLYSLQKDRCFIKPERAALLVHDAESNRCFDEYEPQYVFSMRNDFGLRWNRPSDNAAIAIASLFGCGLVVFLCCDASANGDIRKHKSGTIYTRPYKPENILRHRAMIEEVADQYKMAIAFRTPEAVING